MSTKAYIDTALAAIVQPILDSRDERIAELEAEVRDKVEGMLERGAEIRELRKQLAELREVYRYAKGLCMGEDWNKGTAALYYRKPLREAVEKVTLQESSDE